MTLTGNVVSDMEEELLSPLLNFFAKLIGLLGSEDILGGGGGGICEEFPCFVVVAAAFVGISVSRLINFSERLGPISDVP